MKTGYFTKFTTAFLLTPALLIGTLPASAQSYGRDDNRNQNSQQLQRRDNDRDQQYRRDDRNLQSSQNRSYEGDRYHSTAYVYSAPAPAYRGDYADYRHDDGIGPGKGAAIGAVGGAVLGALFGGGKGAIIGGAAGAGIGAVAGQAAQDNRRSR